MIRQVTTEDAPEICEIYNYYVLKTSITFEEHPVQKDEMTKRIRETTAKLPWLIWCANGHILGYCYASAWKNRPAYRLSVETTVYLHAEALGNRIGSQLYEALISELQQRSVHAAIAGIALPNPASIALHEKFGFEKVAHFKEVGFKFGRWIDVGYWQLIISAR